ncbi:Uncharacterized protein HZ326_5438 [Fusarium oxysporum f. sp. albedinis]|nr:Uncharacterized protein HZ326_5438 [Fusarium oxysporum f. sp. albedinis]
MESEQDGALPPDYRYHGSDWLPYFLDWQVIASRARDHASTGVFRQSALPNSGDSLSRQYRLLLSALEIN